MRKLELLSNEELSVFDSLVSLPWGSTDKTRNKARRTLQKDVLDELSYRRVRGEEI